ncbi:unnamed protein product [Allacma fusca]|uniref:Uncharacterized protein n=1 Tax=Allacma fusca TaxID=39272 RepID=A0A8J2L9G7_9HEXA|nr:unnamed protein product [Allacma fusca]
MVGVKKHLTTITKRMKESGLNNFTTCIFHQGRTSRWGLAWSWDETVKFSSNSQKPMKPAVFSSEFQDISSFQAFMESVEKKLLSLKMKVDKISKDAFQVEAQTNTWSHSRRKRRMELRASAASDHQQSSPVHPAKDLTDLNPEIKGSKNPRLDNTLQDETTSITSRNSNSCLPEERNPDEESKEESACGSSVDNTENSEACLSFQVVGVRDGSAVILHMHYIKGSLALFPSPLSNLN